MKPYRILTATLSLAACLVAVATTPTAHAREATAYERFCLNTMGQIESTLATQLPGDCKIVATHPSPLGQKFATATQIRDAWISRNDKVDAKVFLFAWPLPDDPLLSGATVSQVKLETERAGKKVVLGIAVIGEDAQLVGDVIKVVNRSAESAPLPKLDGQSAKGTNELPVADQEVMKMVSVLSDCLWKPSAENIKRRSVVEANLVALGEQALPVLERELHLGITFRQLNEMPQSERSHRWVVVTALAWIPGEKSTGLLYRSLFDPPDNYAMRLTTLEALKDRDLSDEMIVGLLRHRETVVVLAGIKKAVPKAASPKIRVALERLTHEDLLEVQFKNEYEASLSSKESRWDVRYAAGLALGRDLTDDMRARAAEILQSLKAVAGHLSEPDNRKTMGYMTQREAEICQGLDGLARMGQVIASVVAKEAGIADADYATLLELAKARLGNVESLQRVTAIMNEAANPSIRLCAAMTLRMLKNPAAKPALWKALKDPHHRKSNESPPPGVSWDSYPVRVVAFYALIDLGEDPAQVRASLKQGVGTPDALKEPAPPTGK